MRHFLIFLSITSCIQLAETFSIGTSTVRTAKGTRGTETYNAIPIRSSRRFNSAYYHPNSSSLNLLPSSDAFTTTILSTTNNIPTEAIISSSSQSQIAPTEVVGLSATANTIIFIIGLIPFVWATYEFWSRIAVGASFGTGSDSIQIKPSSEAMKQFTTIGKDGDLEKSRGQQVLGDDALLVAYFLFAVAIGSVGIAVYSVFTSPSSL